MVNKEKFGGGGLFMDERFDLKGVENYGNV